MRQRLLHDFYEIVEFSRASPGSAQAVLALDPEHPILKGHFPGQPVVPGVCMMQITKELLEETLNRETRLVAARNIKFLAIIDPNENKIIRLELSYSSDENGSLSVECTIRDASGEKVFFKMKGTFV